ncbi:hypothetical protein LIA77_06394 [Sarocladium implicatum]|nr:hypothetical protein LIA77_06394 [Sarocladium implicatum]
MLNSPIFPNPTLPPLTTSITGTTPPPTWSLPYLSHTCQSTRYLLWNAPFHMIQNVVPKRHRHGSTKFRENNRRGPGSIKHRYATLVVVWWTLHHPHRRSAVAWLEAPRNSAILVF